MARARYEVVGHEAKDDHQRQPQHRGPVHPVPRVHPDRPGRPEQIRRRDRLRRAVGRVVLPDQWLGISPDDPGDGTDVPPGVEIATARAVVVTLDAGDDCFPDAGPLTDLGHGETGLAACFRQVFADAHGAPPLLYRTARRTGRGCR